MGKSKRWRLEIDGVDFTEDCDDLDIRTPSLVYDVPHEDGRAQRRVLGPRGFAITLIGPSNRLRALADGGVQVHALKVAFGRNAIPVPVQFHEEWADSDGAQKMFGCLASSRDNEPMWVDEPELADA